MKTIVLLFAILTSTVVKAQLNVYHPFPDSNAIWNFEYLVICVGWGGVENDSYSYMLAGDTIIGNHTYHKLMLPGVNVISNTCGNGSAVDIITGYKGAIRQDTTSKKVFFVPTSDSTEQLLYDFNMQVGDTVQGFIESNAFQKDIVQSIDSVLVGSTYRKRWLINPWYGIYFIEGIGSTYGLIEKSPGPITDAPDYSLTCFHQNGQTLYPDTTTQCDFIDASNDIPKETYSIIISPNPFHLSSQLEVSSTFEASKLNIYISLGTLVRTEKVSRRQTFVLHRNNLNNGIYFLQLLNESGQMITERLIVE